MNVALIELLTPDAGDKVWRIRIRRNGTDLPFTTAISLEEPTQRVVEILTRSYRPGMIKTPNGETIHPKPPGGYPQLNSSQRSKR